MPASKSLSLLRVGALWLCLGVASGGCSNPLNPEEGLPLPKDPGAIIVRVCDEKGQPIANVRVSATQPNNIGGTFRVAGYTDAAGIRTFLGVPAGLRPVSIEPPSGYGPSTAGLVQDADVIKGGIVTITFALVVSAP